MLVKMINGAGYNIYFFEHKPLNSRGIIIDDPVAKYYYRNTWPGNQDGDEIRFTGMGQKYLMLHQFAMLKFLSMPWYNPTPQHYVDQIPGLEKLVKHPLNGEMIPLRTVIITLNDAHGWSREEIADWLETLDVNPILNNPKENVNV